MRTNLKQRKEGFTIIEVMIVLAIAGLIMLIVFLAVPALQRNSRNTQRKNDVSNYAAAINEWSQNNRGALPAAADKAQVDALAKLGFYGSADVAYTAITAGATVGVTNDTTPDNIRVVTRARCGSVTPTGQGATAVANSAAVGSARSFVVLYAVENSDGTPNRQCQEG